MSMGVNHLGHFLLVQLLLPELKRARGARCCIVGSVTGNSNTIGGGLVYPRADLGDLSGLKQGPGAEMADGVASSLWVTEERLRLAPFTIQLISDSFFLFVEKSIVVETPHEPK